MKRTKHPRLPSGYGSIRYLGSGRTKPYAVHPPAKDRDEQGVYIRPKALCYCPDWYTAFSVLVAYHAGTYKPGIETEIAKEREQSSTQELDAFCSRIIKNIGHQTAPDATNSMFTFSDVYLLYFNQKYGAKAAKQLSDETKKQTSYGYSRLAPFHNRPIAKIKLAELQEHVNSIDGSKSTVRAAVTVAKQVFRFAYQYDYVEKDIGQFVIMPQTRPEEHGAPLTDTELSQLWKMRGNETADMILIMCYSGFRKSAYKDLEINLKEKYFKGGIKNKTSRNRIVPIHSGIYDLVAARIRDKGKLIDPSTRTFALRMAALLPGHSPHDCRHTFSALCERYGVNENDRRRLLGHSFGADITNAVYGHRTVEELRTEIEKIKTPAN